MTARQNARRRQTGEGPRWVRQSAVCYGAVRSGAAAARLSIST